MCRVDITTGHILPDSDCILEKVRQDEATANDPAILNEVARQKSDEVWSKAPVTAKDVIERAHYAAFYNGVSLDENDNIILPDLASDDRGKRSVAELIIAVFAVHLAMSGRSMAEF